MKQKNIRLLFDKLKKKFQLSIFNESTLESVFSLRVSAMDGVLLALSIAVVALFLSFLLIRYTPVGSFLPPNMDVNVRNRMIENAYMVDSLSDVISKQTRYIDVIKDIIAGEIPVDSTDTKGQQVSFDSLANRHLSLMKATDNELDFRKQYEHQEKFSLSTFTPETTEKTRLFYPPVKGEVIQLFNASQRHFGVDVRVTDRQPVLAVLGGTVVYTGYDPDFRYVIHVQHTAEYLSIYKYNAELLKKPGDVVKAGEAVAIVGKSADSSEPPHLYFELWQKGIPQDPTETIIF